MNTLKAHRFAHRKPWALSTLVVVAAGGLDLVLKPVAELLSLRLSVITIGIISGAVVATIGALIVGRLGLWRALGLIGRPARPLALLWCLPFAIYGLLPLTLGIEITPGRGAGALAFGVLIAFWKLVVLGLILYAWLPRGPRTAAVATAAFWGGMHLGGLVAGAPLVPTLLLALSYCLLGFALVAVRFRVGLLWPLIACYALLLTTAAAAQTGDASNLADSVTAVLPAVGSSIVLAGYGLLSWPRRWQPAECDAVAQTESTAIAQPAADSPVDHHV
ncbi:MAG: hypothetical protein M3400_04950 [Actinomycetota bacterium]|nr:hypothetical protein [Actinomycetota bacterium]